MDCKQSQLKGEAEINTFLSMLMTPVTIVKVPELEIADEQRIRDEKAKDKVPAK